MKVAVIGGSGRAGSQIVQELARRGHQVTAIARNPDKAPKMAGVTAKAVDVHDAKAMTEALKGHDVVVSALRFLDATPAEVISVVKASGVPRYLIVGGASSLLAGGQRLFDSPHFPAEYKPEAGAGIDFLEALKAEPALDWTYLSPSMIFDGDERTGKFRLGGDELLTPADGPSRITFPDFAIAMADEIETPRHSRRRFTVGY
jgi:putative NADH-flavin reductase